MRISAVVGEPLPLPLMFHAMCLSVKLLHLKTSTLLKLAIRLNKAFLCRNILCSSFASWVLVVVGDLCGGVTDTIRSI